MVSGRVSPGPWARSPARDPGGPLIKHSAKPGENEFPFNLPTTETADVRNLPAGIKRPLLQTHCSRRPGETMLSWTAECYKMQLEMYFLFLLVFPLYSLFVVL